MHRPEPRPGTLAAQAFRHQPPDPAWVPAGVLERTRRALREYDSYLRLFWSPMRRWESPLAGRWRVVAWLPHSRIWDTVFYWEGPLGEYRDPDPDAILSKVQSCDAWARGEHLGHVAARVDAVNTETKAKADARANDDAYREAVDKADYGHSDQTGRIKPAHAKKHNFTLGAGS